METKVLQSIVAVTSEALQDRSNYYTTYNRADQGIGLFMEQFRDRQYLDKAMIIFTSDNGNDFPNGRTNLYENGMREPLIITVPQTINQSSAVFTDELVSLLDILPTILDFVGIEYPNYTLQSQRVTLSGVSLLGLLDRNTPNHRWQSIHKGSQVSQSQKEERR